MTREEAAALLVAFGICCTIKQARNYTKNKTDAEMRKLAESLRDRARYSLIND